MLYIIPWRKDNQVASCRLRVFSILPLLGLSYSFRLPNQYHRNDILFIQKVTNEKELKRAKNSGASSGVDADKLDGKDSSDFLTKLDSNVYYN